MTRRTAIWIGGTVLVLLALNWLLGPELHLFVGRKFVDLIEWMAFWR